MNEWFNEWMNERTNERTNEWMIEWMNECTNHWVGEWMDGWMNEWMGDWMHGRTDEQSIFIHILSLGSLPFRLCTVESKYVYVCGGMGCTFVPKMTRIAL